MKVRAVVKYDFTYEVDDEVYDHITGKDKLSRIKKSEEHQFDSHIDEFVNNNKPEVELTITEFTKNL